MIILLEDISKNRAEWLKLRTEGLGSSEIAAVCGLSSYDTRLKIWAEKTGKVQPRPETEDMWMGRMTETITAQLFSKRTKLPVRPANMLCAHDDEPWMLASPDNFVETPNGEKVLEAKFTTPHNRRIWDNGIPETYMAQVNWQLAVCDIDFGYIAGLIGGDAENFVHYEHEFNAELHEIMMEEGYKFMQLIQQDIPPQADAGDMKLLMKLQGDREAKTIKLEGKALEDFKNFEKWQSEKYERTNDLKAAQLEYDRYKVRVVQHMGKNIYGALPDNRVISAIKQTNHGSVTKPFQYVDVRVKKPKEKYDE